MSEGNEFPRDEADYKKLEKLVAKIQQDLAPGSKVSHNVSVIGKSGTRRQIDVLVEDRIGQYDLRIVIDCKDHKQPVDIKGVEECAGLFEDVGAHRGVIVCPAGFTASAKVRAQQFKIELYSPVDTDPHKWQARLEIPVICDFRSAKVAFRFSGVSISPFRLTNDYMSTYQVTDAQSGTVLGTCRSIAVREWNAGRYVTDPGEHLVPLLPQSLMIENGFGSQVPVTLEVRLLVEQTLLFGKFPVLRLSGFRDEIKNNVITNAFEVGVIAPEETDNWLPIDNVSEAPERPALTMFGLYGWHDE